MTNILVLGNFYFGQNFIRAAKEKRFKIVLAENISSTTCIESLGVDELIKVNLTSSDAFDVIINSIGSKKIHAIVPGHVFHVLLQAKLCRYYALPSISEDAAELCLNKDLMREKLSNVGVKQPNYLVVKDYKDSIDTQSLCYPVVVKPANGFASMSVHFSNSHEQTLNCIDELSKGLAYSEKTDSAPSVALIEEQLVGQEFSAEVLCEFGRIVLLGVTGKYFNSELSDFELGFTLPANIENSKFQAIGDYIYRIYSELGIEHGLSHCEFVWTENGPVLIEINPRIGGAHLSDLYELATGYDLFDIALNNALGMTFGVDRLPIKQAAVTGWHIGKQGVIKNVLIPDVNESNSRIFIRKNHGVRIIGLGDNRDRVVAVIATGSDLESAAEVLEDIIDRCSVVYE